MPFTRSYLVLGNYDREPIRRLNLVVDRLNRRQDAYAFRMVDICGERDSRIQKFRLIGDTVTYLVDVAEKDPSDFLAERGLPVGTTEFFAKSHVLKCEYNDEEHPFGWMQTVSSSCSTGRDGCVAGRPRRSSSTQRKTFRDR